MNKTVKNILVSLLLTTLLVVSAPYTFAADSDSDQYTKDGKLSISRCLEKGNLDYSLFLSSFIFSDGFKEGVIEPWKDVLERNQCQGFDVLSLLNQREKISGQIRDAFLTCNTQKVPALKLAFNQVSAEIYYVRHVVDGAIILSLPFNMLSTRMDSDLNSLLYPTEKLKREMASRYISATKFTEDEFNVLFSRLEFKYKGTPDEDGNYSGRVKEYVVCGGNAWEDVSEKWDEFLTSFQDMGQDFERDIGNGFETLSESVTKDPVGGFSIMGISDMSYSDYLGSIVQGNVNGQDPKASFSEFVGFLNDEYISDVVAIQKKAILTKGDLIDAIVVNDTVFDKEAEKKKLQAKYEALYKITSDGATKELSIAIDQLNNSIIGSFVNLDAILECSATMNKRQCPGK